MSKLFKIAVLSFCLMGAGSAQAADLTEARIRAFYEQSAQIKLEDLAAMEKFFIEHMQPDATVRHSIVTRPPGGVPTFEIMHMTRDDFIEHSKLMAESYKTESSSGEVTDVTLGDDGKSATVKDLSNYVGIMSIAAHEQIFYLAVEATQKCNDKITLSEDDVIKLVDSDCWIEMSANPVR